VVTHKQGTGLARLPLVGASPITAVVAIPNRALTGLPATGCARSSDVTETRGAVSRSGTRPAHPTPEPRTLPIRTVEPLDATRAGALVFGCRLRVLHPTLASSLVRLKPTPRPPNRLAAELGCGLVLGTLQIPGGRWPPLPWSV